MGKTERQQLDAKLFAVRGDYFPVVQSLHQHQTVEITELHTPTGTFLVRETMQSLQQRLDPARFVRIHRSRIVRWDQIVELTRQENGEYRVKLPVARVFRLPSIFLPFAA